jgi:RNA-splicing ligase RtcB
VSYNTCSLSNKIGGRFGSEAVYALIVECTIVMAYSRGTLQEEIPDAYKNLDDVVEVVHGAGLSRKVAKLRTLGCIKG